MLANKPIMLSVIMLNVFLFSVVMLSVVAPKLKHSISLKILVKYKHSSLFRENEGYFVHS
jgi:hypothetical protein